MEERPMKRLLCLILAMATLSVHAHADGWVEVKPGKGDLTKAQVKEFAVAFFAEKCGVEESVLRKAEWTIQYGHSTMLTAEDAHWVVDTYKIKGHSDLHYIYLTGPGELIKWGAHIGEYDKAYPDLLDYATPVTPLSTDVQEDTVIDLVWEEMEKLGHMGELTVAATFAYDEHFNSGHIPVWLVQIDGAADGSWKAAVTHKGELLSLVPYEQVFLENQTPGEDFWGATFEGAAYHEEQQLMYGIFEGTLSHEEKAAVTARWRPLVEKWIEEHPYYMNSPWWEHLVTIERVYGVPDDKAIPQEQAEVLAGMALTLRLGDAYLQNREVCADYLVNDPENPVWVIRFRRIKGLSREESKALTISNPEVTSMFNVTVDAYTGEVLGIEPTETIY
jgi:hypothetical protein